MYKNIIFVLVVYFVLSILSMVESASQEVVSSGKLENTNEINIMQFGAKGDGVTNDTVALQRAFKKCSNLGRVCRVPKDKTFLVTEPLFLWGKSSLVNEDGTGVIEFRVFKSLYLLNIGISGKNKIEEPFSGAISGVTFKVSGGNSGRIIYFWRTQGASIVDNIFDVGNYRYSATSSGNVNSWLKNIKLYIRKNIVIKRNKIIAAADYLGSEGIGLGSFDGAIISDNIIIGVGDDPIGVHYSKNIKINNNFMTSVDGRLYVSNSINVDISGNVVQRIESLLNNKFYKGIALIYIGFELYKTNNLSAPVNTHVHHNNLYYPSGSIDHGAAIYLYGPRGAIIEHNRIVNDSDLVIASAIHLLPALFTGKWSDPDKRDPHNVARVWQVIISNNSSDGMFPQRMKMSGNCVDYKGKVIIRNNIASKFRFYCNKKVSLVGNKNVLN